jgi:hypothetical protein
MINTVEFLPSATMNLDDYILRREELLELENRDRYSDELTKAYIKLKEMYEYNYENIIDTDYDEMMTIHYYDWFHKFDDSVS